MRSVRRYGAPPLVVSLAAASPNGGSGGARGLRASQPVPAHVVHDRHQTEHKEGDARGDQSGPRNSGDGPFVVPWGVVFRELHYDKGHDSHNHGSHNPERQSENERA